MVITNTELDGIHEHSTADELARAACGAVTALAARGVVHAELRIAPSAHLAGGLAPDQVLAAVHAGLDEAGSSACVTRVIVCAGSNPDLGSTAVADLATRWMGERVVGVGFAIGDRDARAACEIAKESGLPRILDIGGARQIDEVGRALDGCTPARLAGGSRLIDDCRVVDDRVVALGPTAARVRDEGIPIEIGVRVDGRVDATHPVRLLFDAGFRVLLDPDDPNAPVHGLTDVERAACAERAAEAAFLPETERDALVAALADGWATRPARLLHLAERDRWAAASGSYLPAEWDCDGFIHLSSLHQLLTPANRFYRGRDDLVALVLDAHLLGSAVVWEAGTGTVERFPHLYAALTPEAVLGEIPIAPGPDGGFLLPAALVRAVRSPFGG